MGESKDKEKKIKMQTKEELFSLMKQNMGRRMLSKIKHIE